MLRPLNCFFENFLAGTSLNRLSPKQKYNFFYFLLCRSLSLYPGVLSSYESPVTSRVQRPPPKTTQNRTRVKHSETSSPYLPWNNFCQRKITLELGTSLSVDFNTEPSGRTDYISMSYRHHHLAFAEERKLLNNILNKNFVNSGILTTLYNST